ncbi:hypothetical protein ACSBR2_010290 [Camellia fascicularis]
MGGRPSLSQHILSDQTLIPPRLLPLYIWVDILAKEKLLIINNPLGPLGFSCIQSSCTLRLNLAFRRIDGTEKECLKRSNLYTRLLLLRWHKS